MSKHFTDELIEEIRINNDIVDVVSQYVKLDKKSKYYFGLCPFHHEKTPSFSVTPSKQIFYCYGCGKAGNVVNFIMEIENLEYVEALRFLAERARIRLPEDESEEEREKARLREEIIRINTEAARYFYSELHSKNSDRAIEYLRSRSISPQMIKKFGVGYASENWDSLYKHLKKSGYEDKNILNAGLILVDLDSQNFDAAQFIQELVN